ncbi:MULTISPECIES: phosphatidylglycerophosphatase A family protein [Shewanella]|jgi:phosphatidylglycerophosphatase A|uniref:phosphatidylglycerophosphatase A family protein n=1 Tax=Shewanella TaxID=22 RepID=UPI001675F11C|nr:phosphatidylglycerophosphatase A [Shewanella fodinae]MCL2907962.1 phosphatidylglycerophosphatase A [Shewanella fodinae]GGZ12282.1 phosphatidylglycerophosphatase A [Shewanella fodinae]
MSFFSKDKTLAALSLRNPIHFLALGFGSGLAAIAPGTFGTLAAVPLYLLLSLLPLSTYVIVTLIVCVAGIYICDKTCRDLGVHDHKAIVWDEVAGYLLTMLAAPVGWQWPLIGFVLFRFFDILKPWPIRWLDRNVKGGLGVMADDILAGVVACLVLQLLVLCF